MKSLKFKILFVILIMTIGVAAVTTNIIIGGSTNIAKNTDDFDVYFSDVKINGSQDLSLVRSKTQLSFNKEFSLVGQRVEITYDITNASKNYDASISISCTTSTDYLTIVNDFDTANNLGARQSKSGVLTITQSKSYTGADLTQEISCTINATAVERTSQGNGTVVNSVNPFYVGREVSIGEEKFNIISDNNDETITMLAQYNLKDSAPYKQTTTQQHSKFSENIGWETQPEIDIDISYWSPAITSVINEYAFILNETLNIDSITSDLITLKQLENLGCIIPQDYGWNNTIWGTWTCVNSSYKGWLLTGQYWWTKSADKDGGKNIWVMYSEGMLGQNEYTNYNGIRPTITLPKEIVKNLIDVYPIGKEVSIGDEKFNVISDNGTTVSMLAKYNISNTKPYNQTETQIHLTFADSNGWEYTPGPKEIDIQVYDGESKTILNNYINYLKTEYDKDTTGDFITLKKLSNLGCTVSPDYVLEPGGWTCVGSKHESWLINNQYWWTKSVRTGYSKLVWAVRGPGNISDYYHDNKSGVRPVITISKDALK